MSSMNGNGIGNLLITYRFKKTNTIQQIKEELELKNLIAELLSDKGYQFIIADDELIDEKFLNADISKN